jgi:hypothetical protein
MNALEVGAGPFWVLPGTDIVGPATQASGDLVDQVEPLPTFNGVAGSAGLVGTPER